MEASSLHKWIVVAQQPYSAGNLIAGRNHHWQI
jgi:hypothetical protein